MIITQTPVRLSLLGGGTDYPVHFHRHGGATLSATIDKYTTITVHRLTSFADCNLRVHYSLVESARQLDDIKHPSARECARLLGIRQGVEIHYVSDLPARTGLGSSSSATVGLLAALHAFQGRVVSQETLAEQAVRVEQEMIGERVGCQDQYTCALGGFLHLKYQESGVQAIRLPLSPERQRNLEERLLLVFTGIQRNAHDVLDEQFSRMASGSTVEALGRLQQLVDRGVQVLTTADDFGELGELLHEAWLIKRRLSGKVTSPFIDECYDCARRAGARGGKLLGAGGGGFMLFYVEPENRQRVRAVLSELGEAEFHFERSGCHLTYYRP